MRYYSTNKLSEMASLRDAVIRGIAPDKGLYMPEKISRLGSDFFENIDHMTFREMSFEVADAFFGDEVDSKSLREIIYSTLQFPTPVVPVTDAIYSLELFYGPTLAFKDVGGGFMARLLSYFVSKESRGDMINVLVATSGDTGSAVANGFLGVEGINVYVLYPKGKVSKIQECQFTTLGKNITALEVDGTFDDCQALVKTAFADEQLRDHMTLTSANSINVARFLPQAFYYFNAYSQLKRIGKENELVVSVPSGNFGNITAGLIAKRMGLPIKRMIAANNSNDIFLQYLNSGKYEPRPSVTTLANAMDVGDPSNFARILDLYDNSHEAISADISGYAYSDDQIRETMVETLKEHDYTLDPHGACAYRALKENLQEGECGVFLETAHPAKFLSSVEEITGTKIEIPTPLKNFMKGKKKSIEIGKDFEGFKAFLMSR